MAGLGDHGKLGGGHGRHIHVPLRYDELNRDQQARARYSACAATPARAPEAARDVARATDGGAGAYRAPVCAMRKPPTRA